MSGYGLAEFVDPGPTSCEWRHVQILNTAVKGAHLVVGSRGELTHGTPRTLNARKLLSDQGITVRVCKKCQAGVVHAVIANGRVVAINAEPEPGGNMVLTKEAGDVFAEHDPHSTLPKHRAHALTCSGRA